MDIQKIARTLYTPYATVCDWLLRLHKGRLRRLSNKRRRGRKSKTEWKVRRAMMGRLRNSPLRYGHASGTWQLRMMQDMLRKKFGIECGGRNLCYILKKIGGAYAKARTVPQNTASPKSREVFKANVQAIINRKAKEGPVVLSQDEMHVSLHQGAAYGWRPANGGDTVNVSFSKRSVAIFGVLGADGYHMLVANACDAKEFIEFFKEAMAEYGTVVMVLDSASYHKAKAVRKFVEGANGDPELIFQPPYTPQLNPIEMQSRDSRGSCRGAVLWAHGRAERGHHDAGERAADAPGQA